MITIDAIQGTPQWEQHRKPPMRNASDSPKVMGEGYESRSDFMREWATGIAKEYDDATRARFATGHKFEKLALPLMEEIVGEALYPVVGVNGQYGASFDGLTIAEDSGAEHKQLNDTIRSCKSAAALPLLYRIQMEVQCYVSGAEKILFMATDWDENDNLREEVHFWYEPDPKLRKEIFASWDLFVAEAATYTAPEVLPPAVAAPTLALPAVSIQVSGAVALTSNLGLFLTELKGFIAKIPEKPSTDNEFATCKAACKTLQEAQDALDAAEANALGQVASFDEMKRAKALCVALARTTRLALEKLVVAREKAIKEEIVMGGRQALADHVTRLNARLGKNYMPLIAENFAGVIKNQKTVASLQNKVDTELARCKILANEVADKIQANLTFLREYAALHKSLFPDVSQLVLKDADAFTAIVKSRIAEHEKAEADKLEAERAKIQKEVEAAHQKKLDDEAAKREREEELLARARIPAPPPDTITAEPTAQASQSVAVHAALVAVGTKPSVKLTATGPRPTDDAMIIALALHYRVHELTVIKWLGQIDLKAASARIAAGVAV